MKKKLNTCYFLILLTSVLKIFFLFLFVENIRLWEDNDIAINLINTGKFFYDVDGVRHFAYQFPVYPFIVSCIYKLFGLKPLLVCLYNILINTVTGFLFYFLLKSFFSYFNFHSLAERQKEKIILVSTILFLLHPAINFYALYNVHPFTQNMFLLFLHLFFVIKCVQNPAIKNFLLAGLIFGIGLLDRSTIIVILIPLFILLLKEIKLKKTIIGFSIVLFTSAVIISPWLIRNYQKEKTIGIVPVSGKLLWKGMIENSEGSNYTESGKNYYSALSPNEINLLGKMAATEQDSFFMNKYNEIVSRNPALFFKMYLIKLKNFWWFRSSIGNELPDRLKPFVLAYKIFYFTVLLFMIFAIIRFPKESFFILLVPLSLSLLQSFFFVETRHRIITEPLFIFLAVTGFLALLDLKYLKHSK